MDFTNIILAFFFLYTSFGYQSNKPFRLNVNILEISNIVKCNLLLNVLPNYNYTSNNGTFLLNKEKKNCKTLQYRVTTFSNNLIKYFQKRKICFLRKTNFLFKCYVSRTFKISRRYLIT